VDDAFIVVVVPEMVVVRATVIKIARAIIILKPAFLVVPSPGRWSRGCGTTGGERLARERSVVDIGRGTGRRRWKRMAAAVTATEAGWSRRTAGLAPCTLGIEVRDDQPGGGRRQGGEGPARVGHLFPSRTA